VQAYAGETNIPSSENSSLFLSNSEWELVSFSVDNNNDTTSILFTYNEKTSYYYSSLVYYIKIKRNG